MQPAQILIRCRFFLLRWCGLCRLGFSTQGIQPAGNIPCSRGFRCILWRLCKGTQPAEIVFRPRGLLGRLTGSQEGRPGCRASSGHPLEREAGRAAGAFHQKHSASQDHLQKRGSPARAVQMREDFPGNRASSGPPGRRLPPQQASPTQPPSHPPAWAGIIRRSFSIPPRGCAASSGPPARRAQLPGWRQRGPFRRIPSPVPARTSQVHKRKARKVLRRPL